MIYSLLLKLKEELLILQATLTDFCYPVSGIEISLSPETRDLLFYGWACNISENFNGKGPDFKEMSIRACLRFVVISYPAV